MIDFFCKSMPTSNFCDERKSALSKNDQSIIVFLLNYERSNFLCFLLSFSSLITDCILDRKEKRMVGAIKIVKQFYLQ